MHSIKINVDDSFSYSILVSGIGGVFGDHLGLILLQFAKQVKAELVIHAEILAIMEGMLIAAASRWSGSMDFQIESDSRNAVSCFLDPATTPWRFQNTLREALSCFGQYIE